MHRIELTVDNNEHSYYNLRTSAVRVVKMRYLRLVPQLTTTLPTSMSYIQVAMAYKYHIRLLTVIGDL